MATTTHMAVEADGLVQDNKPHLNEWFWVVVLGGWIGGLIGYLKLRHKDQRRANHVLNCGIGWSVIHGAIGFVMVLVFFASLIGLGNSIHAQGVDSGIAVSNPAAAAVSNVNPTPITAAPAPVIPATLPAAQTIALPTSCVQVPFTNLDPASVAKLLFTDLVHAINTSDQQCLSQIYMGLSDSDAQSWPAQELQSFGNPSTPYQLTSWQFQKATNLNSVPLTQMDTTGGGETNITFSYKLVGPDNQMTQVSRLSFAIAGDSNNQKWQIEAISYLTN